MANCVLQCIWEYICDSELEGSSVEIGLFGKKVIESVITATNFARSPKGVLIIKSIVEFIE